MHFMSAQRFTNVQEALSEYLRIRSEMAAGPQRISEDYSIIRRFVTEQNWTSEDAVRTAIANDANLSPKSVTMYQSVAGRFVKWLNTGQLTARCLKAADRRLSSTEAPTPKVEAPKAEPPKQNPRQPPPNSDAMLGLNRKIEADLLTKYEQFYDAVMRAQSNHWKGVDPDAIKFKVAALFGILDAASYSLWKEGK